MLISIISIFINTFILMYAASYMDIYNAYFGNCFLVSFLSGTTLSVLQFVVGTGSWIISALVCTLFIKFILDTSWGRAFLVYVVMWIVSILLGCLLAFILVTGSCICIPVGG